MLQNYRRLVTDMRETAKLTQRTGEDKAFVCELCGLKLTQAADEFERLLKKLAELDDDRK